MGRRWEYHVVQTPATGVPMGEGDTYAEKFAAGLNELGDEGWQMCGFLSTIIVFMRPTDEGDKDETIQPQRVADTGDWRAR